MITDMSNDIKGPKEVATMFYPLRPKLHSDFKWSHNFDPSVISRILEF